jgi:hypothetical protein
MKLTENLKSGGDMPNLSKRVLFWTPRVLSIFFIAFLSIFALDVFDGHHSFWQTMLAFIIHQIPVFVLIAALILAWRWEWIGAALYGVAGLLDIAWTLSTSRPPFLKLNMILGVACPALVIAGLFLANWLKRGELRATKS